MNSLVNKANRQLSHIKNDLNSLRAALDSAQEYKTVTSQLSASFSGLQSTIRDLDMMSRSEIDMDKRDEYKEKLKLIQADLNNYRRTFDEFKHRISEQEKLKNREELFRSKHGIQENDDTNVTERLIAQREDEVLSNTSSKLDEYISIGLSTISDLRSQKSSLKSTQRRLFDATASLGISQSLMRIISQRSNQERAIFFGGILITLLIIVILWRFF